MLSDTLKKLAKRTPEEMDEIRHDLAAKKLSGDSVETQDSKTHKKSFNIFVVLLLSLSMFFIVPFFLYFIFEFLHFLDYLIELYEQSLLKYFEPGYIKFIVGFSMFLAVLPIMVFLSIFLSDKLLESTHDY